MPDRFPYAAQRAALDRFALALNSSPRALTRDECGDPFICGNAGHVLAYPEGFWLYVAAGSARAWTATKKALAFAKVVNDGDEEGAFLVDREPSSAEAKTIRDYLGIRKRTEANSAPTAAQLAARKAFAERRRSLLAA